MYAAAVKGTDSTGIYTLGLEMQSPLLSRGGKCSPTRGIILPDAKKAKATFLLDDSHARLLLFRAVPRHGHYTDTRSGEIAGGSA